MAAIVNPYFHKSQTNEQSLVDKLITESIQVQGRKYFYMPRDMQIEDTLLGEDAVSNFTMVIPIEGYMVDTTGFQGDKEMFSKFGVQINNSYRLVISQKRWETETQLAFASPTAKFQIQNYIRPREGDLIYDPLTEFLMEIKFVDHDAEFFQLGKNYMYHLSCEAFNYQNENIETGVPDIDVFEQLDRDILKFQMLDEIGNKLVTEYAEYILQEESSTPYREAVQSDFSDTTKIDFKVHNPFDY